MFFFVGVSYECIQVWLSMSSCTTQSPTSIVALMIHNVSLSETNSKDNQHPVGWCRRNVSAKTIANNGQPLFTIWGISDFMFSLTCPFLKVALGLWFSSVPKFPKKTCSPQIEGSQLSVIPSDSQANHKTDHETMDLGVLYCDIGPIPTNKPGAAAKFEDWTLKPNTSRSMSVVCLRFCAVGTWCQLFVLCHKIKAYKLHEVREMSFLFHIIQIADMKISW